ncbi:MAG: hypothetical protein HC912_05825 [Saprospiraceae bacterium]|nr:hypothetical protein [Saprospiraceae bacterium]
MSYPYLWKLRTHSLAFEQIHHQLIHAEASNYQLALSEQQVLVSIPNTMVSSKMAWAQPTTPELENGKVVYKNFAPNADLVVYDKGNGNAGYDVILQPNANIADAQFKVQHDASINDDGELVIPISSGNIRHSAPYAYQEIDGETIEVESRFALAEGILSFEVGAYEEDYALVIDPTITVELFDISGSSVSITGGNPVTAVQQVLSLFK